MDDWKKKAKKTIDDLLPPSQSEMLRNHGYTLREQYYIAKVLSPPEIAIVNDPENLIYLARVKRLSEPELERYDRFIWKSPAIRKKYMREQKEWLNQERYFLGQKLGHFPGDDELAADFLQKNLGQYFRAYYTIKYPERMRKR